MTKAELEMRLDPMIEDAEKYHCWEAAEAYRDCRRAGHLINIIHDLKETLSAVKPAICMARTHEPYVVAVLGVLRKLYGYRVAEIKRERNVIVSVRIVQPMIFCAPGPATHPDPRPIDVRIP